MSSTGTDVAGPPTFFMEASTESQVPIDAKGFYCIFATLN